MARYNEILSGRFNRALQKLLAIKGEAPAPQVASEIMPVFPFSLGNEFRFLESWDRFGFLGSVGAVAAQFGTVRLRNPLGSNLVVVIEKAQVPATSTTAGIAYHSTGNTDLGTILTARRFDARQARNTSAVMSQGTVTPADSVAAVWEWPGVNALQDMILTENQEMTILPGDFIDFQATTVNVAIACALWWRERFMEDSERTG